MPPSDTMTPDAVARACAEAMLTSDNASRALGMSLNDIAPGKATLSMTVTNLMTNGHKICHGGYIFTLADSAFAFACNSYDQRTVAQHCQISFLKPAFSDDVLTASARERWREGRSGIYDVVVHNQAGETIAEFRGHSRTVRGTHLGGDEPQTEEN
ncbi:MAG: hydroxyphenylacetyl-CoA thioesterase PaaI [Pseudomonadota bacterium]